MMLRFIIALAVFGLFASQAQAQIGSQGGPMDITSERLEVIDAENKAVFSGNVDAVQGDTRMRADTIEVFFASGGPGSRAAAGGFGDVERVLATGDVFYVTLTEVARGDRALYELTSETITMTGDVVLTRGANTITGSCLIVDLVTGRSQVNPPSCGGDGQASTTASTGRVRAVLFPSNDNDDSDEDSSE